MQVLQAGRHKLLLLELDTEFIENIARQAGFEFKMEDQQRRVLLELNAAGRQAPLLLFDAADPANVGWFSRCQFYVDGLTGSVLQTPIEVANQRDRGGRALPPSLRPNQQGTARHVSTAEQDSRHRADGVPRPLQFPQC